MKQKSSRLYQDILHTGMLLLAAFVWGMAFSFQSIGADYVEGWTFLTARSVLAVLAMLPFVLAQNRYQKKHSSIAWRRELRAGFVCGFFLSIASGLQQIAISDTTAAKSGFITALYVVLVPVLSSILFRRRQPAKIWLCIVLCIIGLYLLCMTHGFQSISRGDLLTLACAFCFACQILCVGHYVTSVGALKLTFLQFVTETIIAAIFMVLFEHPTWAALRQAAVPILYAGIMSSAVGYSLQAIGQKSLNPAVASLAMCMESVFSALGGWIILGETLTLREGVGCALMFAAILMAELPVEKLLCRKREPEQGMAGNTDTAEKGDDI